VGRLAVAGQVCNKSRDATTGGMAYREARERAAAPESAVATKLYRGCARGDAGIDAAVQLRL
jgi:hypothetical protein